jgi:predicted aspartyl protease
LKQRTDLRASLVSVSFDGLDAYLTVDTGAPGVILDPEFAREIGIVSRPAGVGMFAGGKTAAISHAVVESSHLAA